LLAIRDQTTVFNQLHFDGHTHQMVCLFVFTSPYAIHNLISRLLTVQDQTTLFNQLHLDGHTHQMGCLFVFTSPSAIHNRISLFTSISSTAITKY
jgi:hypothetical protein